LYNGLLYAMTDWANKGTDQKGGLSERPFVRAARYMVLRAPAAFAARASSSKATRAAAKIVRH
jgi:hypothetical protein